MTIIRMPVARYISPQDGSAIKLHAETHQLFDNFPNEVSAHELAPSRPANLIRKWLMQNYPRKRALYRAGLLKRFWKKVDISGGPDACWPWIAGRFDSGYGSFPVNDKLVKAHRFAYAVTFGEPEDRVLHTCDNPPCCNPAHLVDGTHKENMAQRQRRGRQCRGTMYPLAKLNDDLVRSIRVDKRPARVIAEEIGVAKSLIDGVRKGTHWAHVK